MAARGFCLESSSRMPLRNESAMCSCAKPVAAHASKIAITVLNLISITLLICSLPQFVSTDVTLLQNRIPRLPAGIPRHARSRSSGDFSHRLPPSREARRCDCPPSAWLEMPSRPTPDPESAAAKPAHPPPPQAAATWQILSPPDEVGY